MARLCRYTRTGSFTSISPDIVFVDASVISRNGTRMPGVPLARDVQLFWNSGNGFLAAIGDRGSFFTVALVFICRGGRAYRPPGVHNFVSIRVHWWFFKKKPCAEESHG